MLGGARRGGLRLGWGKNLHPASPERTWSKLLRPSVKSGLSPNSSRHSPCFFALGKIPFAAPVTLEVRRHTRQREDQNESEKVTQNTFLVCKRLLAFSWEFVF